MFNICSAYLRLALFLVAFAATGPYVASAQDQSTSGDCGQQQLADKQKDKQKANTKSEVLAKCNGVIRPSQVGDQEMVEPAPSVGRTSVIKPEQNR